MKWVIPVGGIEGNKTGKPFLKCSLVLRFLKEYQGF